MTKRELRREQALMMKQREASELLAQAVDNLTLATNEIINNLRGNNGKFAAESSHE